LEIVVNEIETDKHCDANYLEFLEAWSRLCDEASAGIEDSDSEEMPIDQRLAQPLHVKIENTISMVLKNCTSKSF
jgi:hypothetical protein